MTDFDRFKLMRAKQAVSLSLVEASFFGVYLLLMIWMLFLQRNKIVKLELGKLKRLSNSKTAKKPTTAKGKKDVQSKKPAKEVKPAKK